MQAAFYFSDGLQSTAANPSYFSSCLKPQNPLQPAPSPVGEGWGEGIPRIAAIFPKIPIRPNTSLAACCPLSNSLPRERGRGGCWDEGFCKENRLCRLFFAFQTTFINAQFSRLYPIIFNNLIKISHLLPCRLLFQFLQYAQDFREHIVCLLQNFVIPKTQHGKA